MMTRSAEQDGGDEWLPRVSVSGRCWLLISFWCRRERAFGSHRSPRPRRACPVGKVI